MKAILKTAFVALLLATGSAAVVTAPAADPVIGNWQLNAAKSKFSPGPAPKSDTRTYTASDQGITMTWKSVGADGKEITAKSTFKTDGKVLTLNSKGTSPKGVPYDNVMVYDKQ
jgi:hypothetical protein